MVWHRGCNYVSQTKWRAKGALPKETFGQRVLRGAPIAFSGYKADPSSDSLLLVMTNKVKSLSEGEFFFQVDSGPAKQASDGIFFHP
jgi:hypothetical protein